MKLQVNFKSVFIEAVSLLFVLLFVYAAIAKFLDFENFQIQLGQSPLLGAFACWVSWLVPMGELLIAISLLIPRFRKLGLLTALSLMTMFSVYIFITLHYSSFIPCSCGGILEKMSWEAHFIFNLFFVFLAVVTLLFYPIENRKTVNSSVRLIVSRITATVIMSAIVVIVLFISSDSIIHNKNPFIRRYPHHPIMITYTKDLKFNSYYFAGYIKGRIYLGNYTDPLHLISMDSNLTHERTIKISFDSNKKIFKMVRILIKGDHFYLIDGTVRAVYKGSVSDWKITKKLDGFPYFDLAVPIDSTQIVFRSSLGEKSSNLIGIYSLAGTQNVSYNRKFFKKQIDGVFDTDGMLLYGEQINKIVYLYYYRNEFVIANSRAEVLRIGNTIDTNTVAKIKVTYLKNENGKVMSAPPQTVNHHSAICENLLFVHSNIMGKYEDDKLWDQAFIIDVYDINQGIYLMSFAIYGIEKKKLQSFYVTTTHLYAIIDDQLVVHELRPILAKEFIFQK